jgi:hypothetical protein
MGTVPLAIRINEGLEAWDLAVGHSGHALIAQEHCDFDTRDGPYPDHWKIAGVAT